jgi:hypothetical protein
MATATLPIPQKPRRRATTGAPSVTGELRLRFSPELLSSLAEMAALAHVELAPYILELLEVQIANFRASRIPADFLKLGVTANERAAVQEERKPRGRFRGRFSDEDLAKINEQRDAGMKIPELAERWHVGDSTIRRVLQLGKKPGASPQVVQKIIFLGTKGYDDNDQHIGVSQIAERCNVPETVVSAVLSSHRPLVPASGAIYGRRPKAGGWQRHVEAV